MAMGSTVSHADNTERLSSLLRGKTYCESNLYMQVEGTFLAPLADESGTGLFSITDLDGVNTVVAGTRDQYTDEFTAAPRITLGYRGKSDWGLQFRYWELDAESDSSANFPAAPANPANVDTVGSSNFFNAYTLDLELTRDMRFRETSILGTFGVRHAKLDQGSQTDAYGVVANGNVVDAFNLTSLSGSTSEGTGLTGSLSMLRQLQRAPALSLFVSGRSSILFGDAGSFAQSSAIFTGTAGQGTDVQGAIGGIDEALFIGEIQAGLQWSKNISSFNARSFARATFEYQYWGADGDTTLAVSTQGTAAQSNGTAIATASGFDNQLIGFGLSTGFVW
jgi:hypothetical protein